MLISSAPLKSRIRTRLTISKINVRQQRRRDLAGAPLLQPPSLPLSLPLPSNNQPNPPSSDSFTDLQKLFLIKDSPCQLALTHRTFLIKERTISLPSLVVSSVRHPRSRWQTGERRKRGKKKRNSYSFEGEKPNGEREKKKRIFAIGSVGAHRTRLG